MTITSYGFLLLFFPLALALYWSVRGRARLWVLWAASYGFYALADLRFLLLLLGLSALTYWLALTGRTRLGVGVNLLALALFKYLNFGIDNVNALAGGRLPLLELALPLGISFYVFKHIGYLIDTGGGRYPPTRDFLLFSTFSAFFPQISAGPISSFDDTGPQLMHAAPRPTRAQVSDGLLYISVGLAKKLLIADVLLDALGSGLFSAGEGGGLIWAWLSVLMYAIQLYFDFSAYTDMVLGVALLFGVVLPPNFDNPYLATSPRQFWDRWHMSLTGWFRSYLFFPVSRALLRRWGGGRSAQAQYAANLITMGLIGLWHGAGWGFVLWGVYHALVLNLYAWGRRRGVELEGHLPLWIIVLFGWALFLSPDLGFAAGLIRQMVGLDGLGAVSALPYDGASLLALGIGVLLILNGRVEAARMRRLMHRPVYALVLAALAALAILFLSEAATFTYVQF